MALGIACLVGWTDNGGKAKAISARKERRRGGDRGRQKAKRTSAAKVRRDGRRANRRGRRVGVGAEGFQEAHDVIAQRKWNTEVEEARTGGGEVGLEGRGFDAIRSEEVSANRFQEGQTGGETNARKVIREKRG